MSKFIAYYRVSTAKQGQSGLGLEAQQVSVRNYLAGVGGELVGEFQEVETGKGSNALAKRPQLREALAMCRKAGAVLIIAKLDRLARNVHFVSGLLETGVEFVAADMPQANKTMIHMHAVMAEWERDQISARTKAALAAAKARGVVLGAAGSQNLKANIEARQEAANAAAERLRVVLEGLVAKGMSGRQMAAALMDAGIKTPTGKDEWTHVQVGRTLKRLELAV